jgi:hypothetical protein
MRNIIKSLGWGFFMAATMLGLGCFFAFGTVFIIDFIDTHGFIGFIGVCFVIVGSVFSLITYNDYRTEERVAKERAETKRIEASLHAAHVDRMADANRMFGSITRLDTTVLR